MSDAIVLDGFLDDEIAPGPHGSTARFRLTVSPTDELVDEMILPCTVNEPVMAYAVLHELRPGDQLCVTGHLRLPRTPDEPMWMDVNALEVLDTAPLMSTPESVVTTVLERYGPYACVHLCRHHHGAGVDRDWRLGRQRPCPRNSPSGANASSLFNSSARSSWGQKGRSALPALRASNWAEETNAAEQAQPRAGGGARQGVPDRPRRSVWSAEAEHLLSGSGPGWTSLARTGPKPDFDQTANRT
ncbi:hypothetical protein ACFTTN_03340 [Streptomyces niveus]|uniref:hypothetical protein n=1 Tax=Streptomyces niveus TaxID=193462 RepID=UPI0036354D2D